MKIFNKDLLVAESNEFGYLKVKKGITQDQLPISLFGYNKEFRNIIPKDQIERWLKSRVIPENREDIKSLLGRFGLKEYNIRDLIRVSRGKTFYDEFEVELGRSNEKYSFEEVMTRGILSKYANSEIMIEGSSENCIEPISQYLGSELFKHLSGLPTADYTLRKVKETDNVQSYCGLVTTTNKSNNQVVSLFDYITSFFKYDETYSEYDILYYYWRIGLSEEFLMKLLVFDAFIGNSNRHLNNIKVELNNGELSNALVSDLGRSLLYNFHKKPVSIECIQSIDKSKPFERYHESQVKFLTEVYPYRKLFDFKWNYVETIVEGVYDKISSITESKVYVVDKEIMIAYLKERYNKYILPFLIK